MCVVLKRAREEPGRDGGREGSGKILRDGDVLVTKTCKSIII